ncbi:MAG: stage III sporulation protein AA [Aristaeellaceae bacterium]
MTWEETCAFLHPCFPEEVHAQLSLLSPGELREIRVRAGQSTLLCTADTVIAVPWYPPAQQVEQLAEALSGHSLYARTDETGQGYATLPGGHRMGLCGHVQEQDGNLALRDIGSVCIRIAGQWPGVAQPLLPLCRPPEGLRSLLLIGPPGSGKTTLLRDLARLLASGSQAVQTAIIDERGELAACVKGVPQLDVGLSTDVLDGCPKPEAMSWLLRSMAPQVIVTDELAHAGDVAAVMDAMSCGVAVMASVHGAGLHELAARPAMASLLAQRCFRYYAVLSPMGGGRIAAVYDRSGTPVKSA